MQKNEWGGERILKLNEKEKMQSSKVKKEEEGEKEVCRLYRHSELFFGLREILNTADPFTGTERTSNVAFRSRVRSGGKGNPQFHFVRLRRRCDLP